MSARCARQWRSAHEIPIVREFMDLLTMPNLARDSDGIRGGRGGSRGADGKAWSEDPPLGGAGCATGGIRGDRDARRGTDGGVLSRRWLSRQIQVTVPCVISSVRTPTKAV